MDKKGKPIVVNKPKPYTIEGLCVHLNIDRRTLLNYQKQKGYEEYFHIIKRAKLKINAELIEGTMTGKYKEGISIFNLKNNFGYTDKQEVEHSGETSTTVNFKIEFGD